MKYIAAYLLLALAGKEQPTAQEIEGVLSSVGANVDKAALDQVVNGLKGKKIHEVINEGSKKLSTMSFGGAGGAPAEGGKPAAKEDKKEDKKDAGKKEAAKKEEPKKEEPADDDVGLGGGLFDDF